MSIVQNAGMSKPLIKRIVSGGSTFVIFWVVGAYVDRWSPFVYMTGALTIAMTLIFYTKGSMYRICLTSLLSSILLSGAAQFVMLDNLDPNTGIKNAEWAFVLAIIGILLFIRFIIVKHIINTKIKQFEDRGGMGRGNYVIVREREDGR